MYAKLSERPIPGRTEDWSRKNSEISPIDIIAFTDTGFNEQSDIRMNSSDLVDWNYYRIIHL